MKKKIRETRPLVTTVALGTSESKMIDAQSEKEHLNVPSSNSTSADILSSAHSSVGDGAGLSGCWLPGFVLVDFLRDTVTLVLCDQFDND